MIHLPRGFADRPFAHRGLHDRNQGIVENSPSAIAAAVTAGYGIEIDVQSSSDGAAMVFHDYSLQRLTGEVGVIQQTSSTSLAQLVLTDSTDTVPTLPQVLELVAGRVPLLIEIKDQDGEMGPNVGNLQQVIAEDLAGYGGEVAMMSFNPHAIAAFRKHNTTVPVGLVTDPFSEEDWPMLDQSRREELAEIPDSSSLGCAFISHNQADLASHVVARQKANGLSVFCWTVTSEEDEVRARNFADTITFEGYAA